MALTRKHKFAAGAAWGGLALALTWHALPLSAQNKATFSSSRSGIVTPDLSKGDNTKFDDQLLIFKGSNSIGPAGEIPLVPESTLSAQPKNKDLFKLYDKKRNWIFSQPGDLAGLSKVEDKDFGLDKWSMDNKGDDKTALVRFLENKRHSSSLVSTNNTSRNYSDEEFSEDYDQSSGSLDPMLSPNQSPTATSLIPSYDRNGGGVKFSSSSPMNGKETGLFGNQAAGMGGTKSPSYLNATPMSMEGLFRQHSALSKSLLPEASKESSTLYGSILESRSRVLDSASLSRMNRTSLSDPDPTTRPLNPTSANQSLIFSASNENPNRGGVFSSTGAFAAPGSPLGPPNGFKAFDPGQSINASILNNSPSTSPMTGPATINVMSPSITEWAVRKF